MVRRSTIIFAASLAVLSTLEQVSCFAVDGPPQGGHNPEKPRYLKRHTKRFILSYTNATATTSRGLQGPVGVGEVSTSNLQTLSDTLTTPNEPSITPSITQTPDLSSIEFQSKQLEAAVQESLSKEEQQQQQQQTQTSAATSATQPVSSLAKTSNEETFAGSTSAASSFESSASSFSSFTVPAVTPPSITIPSVTPPSSSQNNVQSLSTSAANQPSPSAEAVSSLSGTSHTAAEAASSITSPNGLPVSLTQTPRASIESAVGQTSSAIPPPSNVQSALSSIPEPNPVTSVSSEANAIVANQQLTKTPSDQPQATDVDSSSTGSITRRSVTPESQIKTGQPSLSPQSATQQPPQSSGESASKNPLSQVVQPIVGSPESTRPTTTGGKSATTGGLLPTIEPNTQQPLTQPSQTKASGEQNSATAGPSSQANTNTKPGTLNSLDLVPPVAQSLLSTTQAPASAPDATHTDTGAPAKSQTSGNGFLPSVGASLSESVGAPLPTSHLTNGAQPASSPSLPETAVIPPTVTNSKPLGNQGESLLPTATLQQGNSKASNPLSVSQSNVQNAFNGINSGSAVLETSKAGVAIPPSQTNELGGPKTALSQGLNGVSTDSNKGLTAGPQSVNAPVSTIVSNGVSVPVTNPGIAESQVASHLTQQIGSSQTGTPAQGKQSGQPLSDVTSPITSGLADQSEKSTAGAGLPLISQSGTGLPSPAITPAGGSVATSVPAAESLSQEKPLPGVQSQPSGASSIAPIPVTSSDGRAVLGSSVSPAPAEITPKGSGLPSIVIGGSTVANPFESLAQGTQSPPSPIASNEAPGSSNTGVPNVVPASSIRSDQVRPNSAATAGQLTPSIGASGQQATSLPASVPIGQSASGANAASPSQTAGFSGAVPQLSSTTSNGVVVPIQSSQPVNTGAVIIGSSSGVNQGVPSAPQSGTPQTATSLPISGASSPVTVGYATDTKGSVSPITAGQITGTSSIPSGTAIPLVASIPTTAPASGQPALSGLSGLVSTSEGAFGGALLHVQSGSATGANSQVTGAAEQTAASSLGPNGQSVPGQSGGATIASSAGASGPTEVASGQSAVGGSSGASGAKAISGGTAVASEQSAVGQASGASGATASGAQVSGTSGQSAISQPSGVQQTGSNTQATAATGQSAAGQTVAPSGSSGQIVSASQSTPETQPAPAPVTGTVTGPPAESQVPQTTAVSNAQQFPSNAKGPFTQSPTGYDSATVQTVPTSILAGPSSLAPSQSGNTEPTGIPTGVPLVLYPPEGFIKQPDNTQLIQVGFLYPLNYDFVYQNPQSQQQIFKYLPMGIAWGLSIDVENVTMQTLRAWDTTQDLHYITTLALAWIPTGQVEALGLQVHTPTSRFYHTPDNSTNTLLSMINIALPINADNSTDGGAGGPVGAVPSSSSNAKDGGAPVGGGIGSSNPVRASSVGIGCGVAVGAAVYGAAMFLVARRYKKRRQSHLRSPSMFSSPVMSHVGPDAGAGAALMSGGMGDHRSPSPYRDEDGRGPSRGSGRSGSTGRQQISAPVMAENSLGWN